MKIRIKIEYDGTRYSGWQKQDGADTIQGRIEKAIQIITGKETEIFGSGRTDAGVHALGQVAHFETEKNIMPEKIKFAINQHLPEDIRIIQSESVNADFHARFDVKRKVYLYRIQVGKIRRPFERYRSYFVRGELDVEKMRKAANSFVGEHDFSSFKSEGSSAKNFVREIFYIRIEHHQDIITMEFCGNGFLYNMVRIISGTLIDIGKGKDYDIDSILKAKDRRLAGPTAPAHALYLKEVKYDDLFEL